MAPTIVAGTDAGIYVLGDAVEGADVQGRAPGAEAEGAGVEAGAPGVELEGRAIGALAAGSHGLVAVADGAEILRRDGGWSPLASLPSREARCILPVADGLLIGTTEAHLLRLAPGGLETVQGFERVAGREDWFTPWGGPPATRSLSEGAAGELYANVHVGGIPRSDDGGATWGPTIEIEVDAHEVRSPADRPGLVIAATAHGLATSRDSGETWELAEDGLAATYARAVALAGDVVLMSASDGPRGGHAAVYRRALDDASAAFERCTAGLPDWFADNIDTACLQASGTDVGFGTATGEVYASRNAGESWERIAEGLPPVRCLVLTPAS